MIRLKDLSVAIIGTAVLTLGAGKAAQAATFYEMEDAGQLLDSAQVIGTNIDKIAGVTSSGTDAKISSISKFGISKN